MATGRKESREDFVYAVVPTDLKDEELTTHPKAFAEQKPTRAPEQIVSSHESPQAQLASVDLHFPRKGYPGCKQRRPVVDVTHVYAIPIVR